MKPGQLRIHISAAFVGAATFFSFVPSIHNGFVNWDDATNFINNPYYKGFSWNHLAWMFSSFHMGSYIPLSWITLAIDYDVWGMNPLGYHLTNVVWHSLNAVLCFYVLCQFMGQYFETRGDNKPGILAASGFGALFFALHPLRVESVAWVTERRDVLSGFFFLCTIYLYLRTTQSDRPGRIRYLRLSYAAYILSLFSKATGMTLPLLLWVMDLTLLKVPIHEYGSSRALEKLKNKGVFFLLALPFAVVAFYGQKKVDTLASWGTLRFPARLTIAAHSFVFYVTKTIWPFQLSPFYDIPAGLLTTSWTHAFFVASVVFFCFGFLIWIWPRLAPAGLWYVIALLPNAGFSQTGFQISADRYSYIPCLSLAVVAGAGLCMFLKRIEAWPQRLLGRAISGIGVLVLLFCFMDLTRAQILVWSDSQALWDQALRVSPNSPFANLMMGKVMMSRPDNLQAIHYFKQATWSPFTAVDAFSGMGVALAKEGRMEEAVACFRRVLEDQPGDPDALHNYQRALSLLRTKNLSRHS